MSDNHHTHGQQAGHPIGHADPGARFRLPRGTFPPGREEQDLPTVSIGDAASVAPPPPMPFQTAGTPAGFFRRALAFWGDLMVVELLATLLGTMATMGRLLSEGMKSPFAETAPEAAIMFSAQVFPLLLFCYFLFFTGYGGRTPGKMLFGLAVERTSGEVLGWGRSLARTCGYLASLFTWGLGFLMAAGPAKKALHDRLTGTRVVTRRTIKADREPR